MAQTAGLRKGIVLPTDAAVLSKAVARAAEYWNLTNETLGHIIGVSASTASRLRAGTWRLERGTKQFELGQFLVRLFRSVDSLMGSDDRASISWLDTTNLDIDGKPIDLIKTVKGLTEVANYVDDLRARV